MRRSRLLVLVVAVAVVAAGSASAITRAADDTGSTSTGSTSLVTQSESYGRGLTEIGTIASSGASYAQQVAQLSRLQQAAAYGGPGAEVSALYGVTPREAQYVTGITFMTPEQQAAAFGR
jgi:hypothetical protein